MNEQTTTEDRSQFAERDDYRDLTPYEEAVLHGMTKPAYIPGRGYCMVQGVYQGYADDQVVTHRDGTTEVVPDPRIARTERRRAKNRVARKSRRVNRIRAAR
ncbi:hypothetical protein HOV42_gp55 [Gordonia phage Fairfaxidum]|uniref:Uncharacterized protein n=2 Tax=Fairfaxidumvirus TaxID=2731207 RepID=A0A5J6TCJ2_9CAUD|nr:hypothetical protein HOV42_gp55 [Gordonia phage Fairfaxidum]YP_010001191.1 hypothetical protein JZX81_gp54 [Gordonia phage Toast]QCG77638.1 hypothetical protein SEA_FAIRFAXIDUM_55 [Gordonia phage Fairfaxidum]QFG08114.1 hypothetical protein PBI_TOAST_54 [Gordonia phage Toast]UVF60562.1 hypothetical protein SEA_PCORAL7_54 [Gordonia phage PCoral7]